MSPTRNSLALETCLHNCAGVIIPCSLLIVAAMLAGCQTPPGPYVPKASVSPEVVYCNDNTGHKAGSKPFIQGGTCCCTPSDELMEKLHKDGYCLGMDADGLRSEYEAAGIVLKGPGHQWCNGLCPSGPHVVLGGKCMCPPTPGTAYYEKIVTGKVAVTPPAADTHK